MALPDVKAACTIKPFINTNKDPLRIFQPTLSTIGRESNKMGFVLAPILDIVAGAMIEDATEQ